MQSVPRQALFIIQSPTSRYVFEAFIGKHTFPRGCLRWRPVWLLAVGLSSVYSQELSWGAWNTLPIPHISAGFSASRSGISSTSAGWFCSRSTALPLRSSREWGRKQEPYPALKILRLLKLIIKFSSEVPGSSDQSGTERIEWPPCRTQRPGFQGT